MRITKRLLPENWLFKIMPIILETAFIFYLFQFLSKLELELFKGRFK
jgi:hypothetical protein